jgi:hypothetical protein
MTIDTGIEKISVCIETESISAYCLAADMIAHGDFMLLIV